MTDREFTVMHHRQVAAESSLRFFTDKKEIIPGNIPSPYLRKANKTIIHYRANTPHTVMSRFDEAAKSGFGNCTEKAFIVFASLSRNPRLIPNSFVYLASLHTKDHIFVVVTDKGFCNRVGYSSLSRLSSSTLVVDGWAEDWYFPNLDIISASSLGFMNRPKTVRQSSMREACMIYDHRLSLIDRLF